MTLKFKRNYPLVLMLVGILSILVLTAGNQPIASYTVDTNTLQTSSLATIANGISLLTGSSGEQSNTAGLYNITQP